MKNYFLKIYVIEYILSSYTVKEMTKKRMVTYLKGENDELFNNY